MLLILSVIYEVLCGKYEISSKMYEISTKMLEISSKMFEISSEMIEILGTMFDIRVKFLLCWEIYVTNRAKCSVFWANMFVILSKMFKILSIMLVVLGKLSVILTKVLHVFEEIERFRANWKISIILSKIVCACEWVWECVHWVSVCECVRVWTSKWVCECVIH